MGKNHGCWFSRVSIPLALFLALALLFSLPGMSTADQVTGLEGNGEEIVVYMLGSNSVGQLGLGDQGSDTDRFTPTPIEGLTNVKQVAVGRAHTLVLLQNGDVYSFGRNNFGQLGLGDTVNRSTPTKIESLSGVKKISAGTDHSLALLEDGTVYSFGNRGYGMTGHDGPNEINWPEKSFVLSIPSLISTISNVKDISAGGAHSLVLLENGDVYAFGCNATGNLGLGYADTEFPKPANPLPAKVLNISNAKAVSAGNNYSLILLENGDVYSFGSAGVGKLGLGELDSQGGTYLPTPVSTPTQIEDFGPVKAICAGVNHSLFLMENNDVYACGLNHYGEVSTDNIWRVIDTPTKMETFQNARAIAAGYQSSFIVLENGDVYSSGLETYGQLGHKDKNDKDSKRIHTPTRIDNIGNVIAVDTSPNSAGSQHTVFMAGPQRQDEDQDPPGDEEPAEGVVDLTPATGPATVAGDKIWTISFNQRIAHQSINSENFKVLDANNQEAITGLGYFTINPESVNQMQIKPLAENGYEPGEYTLHISNVESSLGKVLTKPVIMRFRVE